MQALHSSRRFAPMRRWTLPTSARTAGYESLDPRRSFWAVAAFSIGYLFVPSAPVRGRDWDNDVRFVYCDDRTTDADSADDGDTSPPYYYGGCNSYGSNYASNLKQQLTCCMQEMQACGVTYEVAGTQFYQGVASGSAEQEFEYGGKVDQFVILDSGKLGLWQGMTMSMHAETRFGEDVNLDAVGFAPVNVAMLYPKSSEDSTAITGLTFTQALDNNLAVMFGKINALDLFYELYPQTGRGINGFMNASMVIPLAVAQRVLVVVHGRWSVADRRPETSLRQHVGLRHPQCPHNQRL